MTYTSIQYQQSTEPVLATSVNFESNWHEPWSDPKQTIAKKAIAGVAIALMASGLFAPSAIQIEPTLTGKWVYPWSEPVRLDLRHGLKPPYQQALAFQLTQSQQPEAVTESRWHEPWSEPVRFKIDPKCAVALARSGPFDPPYSGNIDPINVYIPWFKAWADPVWPKRGLKLHLQQSYASNIAPILPTSTFPWFKSWAEPVRLKPRLRDGAQQSIAEWLGPPIPISIFVTMAITESGSDVAEMSVNVYGSGTTATNLSGANVSIEEVSVPLNNPVSIRT